jgi:hypothetical protein
MDQSGHEMKLPKQSLPVNRQNVPVASYDAGHPPSVRPSDINICDLIPNPLARAACGHWPRGLIGSG